MSIKQQIISVLKDAVSKLGITDIEPQLEIPEDYSHGDYSTNLALLLSKRIGKNPMVIADEIVANFKFQISPSKPDQPLAENFKSLDKVEVIKPGFINFWLPQDFLSSYLDDLLSGKDVYASIKVAKPRFEMYENTQPNTNKPLHIGHLRNIALGTSMVNLRKTLGHKVWSVNLNNDRGIHIMKADWGYLAYGESSKFKVQSSKLEKPEKEWKDMLKDLIEDPERWETPESTKMKADHFVGKFYVLGEKAEIEFGESVTREFQALLGAWEDKNKDVRALWKQMNEWFYDGFKQTHARFLDLGPSDGHFDKEWFESDIYEAGKKIVLDNISKGFFFKSEDGAVIGQLKKYGLPDKVVIRSDGTSIYITQDIELARIRIQEEKADFVAYIVGNEQDLHFKQLFAICEELGIGKKDQFLHMSYGMVNLAGGVKMSSREGTAVIADEFMDTVVKKINEQFHVDNKEVLEQISTGAIKYWMLKYNPKAAISFDVNESVSIHGNSGPYLQYTHARTQSVLAKSQIANRKSQIADDKRLAISAKLAPEELLLLRLLHRFPDVVEEAAERFSPNLLCNYLFALSSQFNLFYQKHPILKSDNSAFRLQMTRAVGQVIKNGLELLGMKVPDRM